jgi:acetyl esterase/lipase
VTYAYDPELAPIVPTLPGSDFRDPVAARQSIAQLIAQFAGDVDLSGLAISDLAVPGPPASPPVTVRVYQPNEQAPPTAALLYIHGGGFVLGSIETEHMAAATLAKALGAVIASVEYRLAPEHPFPAGIDDCYAALVWLHANAEKLGVDPDHIGVYGASAGGGLAAGLALYARDHGGPALCFQFLGIPELDDRLETASMRAFTDTPLWNRPNAELSWRYYLGEHSSEVSPYAAPARATDLTGLPPAYVSTMEFDPLRDEGIIYALGMLEAGVQVELHTFPGTFHGSSIVPTAAVSQRVAAEQIVALRRGLGLRQ